MHAYRFTDYFEKEVLRKRPYLRTEWCIFVIENAIKVEVQDDDRVRFWARVDEFGDRVLRVVTLSYRKTIHNAFPDSNFKQ
jgi:hypothetical protein